jgi:carbon storage regulator
MRKGRINMLALSRKIGESIMIGNEIEISVLEIKGDQVKLGISAPKSIPVYRREIYIQIQDANKEAAESTVSVDELRKLFK